MRNKRPLGSGLHTLQNVEIQIGLVWRVFTFSDAGVFSFFARVAILQKYAFPFFIPSAGKLFVVIRKWTKSRYFVLQLVNIDHLRPPDWVAFGLTSQTSCAASLETRLIRTVTKEKGSRKPWRDVPGLAKILFCVEVTSGLLFRVRCFSQ